MFGLKEKSSARRIAHRRQNTLLRGQKHLFKARFGAASILDALLGSSTPTKTGFNTCNHTAHSTFTYMNPCTLQQLSKYICSNKSPSHVSHSRVIKVSIGSWMPINISHPHHVIGTNNKLSLKAAYFLKHLLVIPVRNSINYLQPVTKWELGIDCCVSPHSPPSASALRIKCLITASSPGWPT